MSDLKSCPFCGGEAHMVVNKQSTVREYFVGCMNCHIRLYKIGYKRFLSEAEAIDTWNTRAEHHAYEQRITGDGSDWGEIMMDAYDDLMASACESCTPEQIAQLADHIRAELGGGTCEMVTSGAACKGNTDKRCTACGAYGIGEHYDGDEHIATPKFCPECGAKVVSE